MKSEKKKITLSIIYVYYNTPKELVDSLKSLPKAALKLPYEIIIVDNNSPRPIPRNVFSQSETTVIKNKENKGFGAAINQAARIAAGTFLLFINPDTVLFPGSIASLHSRLEKDETIGVIGPKVLGADGRTLDSISLPPILPNALVIFTFLKKLWPFRMIERRYHLRHLDRDKEQEVPVVSGVCMFMRKEVFRNVKGFDKKFFMYFEEADLCIRIQRLGLKNLYYPQAQLTHLVGRSTDDKQWIQKVFESSRYTFFKKYHGTFIATSGELLLRLFTVNNVLLISLLMISSFLMFYRLGELMMFFGDFGRDYLAARDGILSGELPLVGITSSVTWLHQGPLSVWFIALSLIVARFNPIAPAYLYALFGVITTLLIYKAGELLFNKATGFFAALLFTTSPLVLINLRIPYHTAPIPLFSVLFLFFLWNYLKDRRYVFLLGLTFGLLLLLELSNAVLFFVLGALFFLVKLKMRRREILKGASGFLVGVAPFIIYDITHGFTQTVGFALWVINRIRLFFGLTLSGASTTASVPSAFETIWGQIRRMIYPQDNIIVISVLFIVVYLLFIKRGEYGRVITGLSLCLTWVIVSLFGFAVHAAPGTAYFPLIFIPAALLLGYSFSALGEKWKPLYLFLAILVFSNVFYVVSNQYFLDTKAFQGSKAKGWDYGLGEAFSERKKVASFIVNDANGAPLQIKGGGFLKEFPSSVDNYKYLIWLLGGTESEDAISTYVIYQSKNDVPKGKKVIYTNSFAYVTKG